MNKIAIVTGASQGIGRGIALKLAKEGYDIAFSFFSATQRAEELCAEIQSTTAQRCAMYCVDMRKDGAGAKFVNQVSEEMGVPCVLVNNAGRTRMESILDMTPETVDELINLDLKIICSVCRLLPLRWFVRKSPVALLILHLLVRNVHILVTQYTAELRLR